MDYLETIDEYMNDERRIVTYRWLSLTMGVSSNKAKQMLYHYYDKQKKESPSSKLQVTYLVSGEIADESGSNSIKVTVCQEDKLEETKKLFSNIFSVHVYSLQLSHLEDLNILYGVDYDIIKNKVHESAKQSSIICPSASFRTRNVKVEPEKKSPPVNEKINTEKDKSRMTDNKENHLNNSKKNEKKTISSMFTGQMKKNDVKKSESKSKNSNSKSSPVFSSSKSNPLANFIVKGQKSSKESLSSSKQNVKASESPKKIKTEVCEEVVLDRRTSPRKLDQSSSSTSQSPKNENSQMKSRSPKKTTSHSSKILTSDSPKKIKESIPSKKRNSKKTLPSKKLSSGKNKQESERKRIVQPFDSSSESNNEEDDLDLDENPYPTPKRPSTAVSSSDEENVLPKHKDSLPECVTSSGRSKRRKLVDKTYQDEDGFFVTKKEYEMVSDSDEENPLPSSVERGSKEERKEKKGEENEEKNAKGQSAVEEEKRKFRNGKKSSPVKTKQSSIMNFFKKK